MSVKPRFNRSADSRSNAMPETVAEFSIDDYAGFWVGDAFLPATKITTLCSIIQG